MINIAFVSQSFLFLQAMLSNSTSKDSVTDSQMVPEYTETSNMHFLGAYGVWTRLPLEW